MSTTYTDLYNFFANLPAESVHVTRCIYLSGEESNTRRHSHETLELDYFIRGQHTIVTGANNVPIVSHACNVIGYMPECVHQGAIHGPQETIVIWFDIPKPNQELITSFQLDDKTGTLRWLFEQIHAEYKLNHPESLSLISCYASAVLKQICRLLRQPTMDNLKSNLLKLLQYIESNFSSYISVEQMARQLNVSESHLYKLFKDCTGLSPAQYIQKLRIEQAKTLLSTSDYRISEISEMCGYDDERYFSRLFKKVVSLTPSAYRKNSI